MARYAAGVVATPHAAEMATLWAAVITAPPGIRGESAEEVRAFAARHGSPLVIKPDIGSGASDTWRFGTAHAGRRDNHSYRLSHAALVAQLEPLLFSEKPIPKVFSVTMGDHMYLLRHPALETLRRAIALVHAR